MVGARPGGQLPLPWLAAPLQQALAQPGRTLLLVGTAGVGALDFLLRSWPRPGCVSPPGEAMPVRCTAPSCHLVPGTPIPT